MIQLCLPIWSLISWLIWGSTDGRSSRQWRGDNRSYYNSLRELQYPLNSLKVLTDTVVHYYCWWVHLASDWTMESDHCEERERSVPTLSYCIKQLNESESIPNKRIWICPYDGTQKEFLGIQRKWLQNSWHSEDRQGYDRLDCLCTRMRQENSVCIQFTRIFQWCVVSPGENGRAFGCQTDSIRSDKYVTHWASLVVHSGGQPWFSGHIRQCSASKADVW